MAEEIPQLPEDEDFLFEAPEVPIDGEIESLDEIKPEEKEPATLESPKIADKIEPLSDHESEITARHEEEKIKRIGKIGKFVTNLSINRAKRRQKKLHRKRLHDEWIKKTLGKGEMLGDDNPGLLIGVHDRAVGVLGGDRPYQQSAQRRLEQRRYRSGKQADLDREYERTAFLRPGQEASGQDSSELLTESLKGVREKYLKEPHAPPRTIAYSYRRADRRLDRAEAKIDKTTRRISKNIEKIAWSGNADFDDKTINDLLKQSKLDLNSIKQEEKLRASHNAATPGSTPPTGSSVESSSDKEFRIRKENAELFGRIVEKIDEEAVRGRNLNSKTTEAFLEQMQIFITSVSGERSKDELISFTSEIADRLNIRQETLAYLVDEDSSMPLSVKEIMQYAFGIPKEEVLEPEEEEAESETAPTTPSTPPEPSSSPPSSTPSSKPPTPGVTPPSTPPPSKSPGKKPSAPKEEGAPKEKPTPEEKDTDKVSREEKKRKKQEKQKRDNANIKQKAKELFGDLVDLSVDTVKAVAKIYVEEWIAARKRGEEMSVQQSLDLLQELSLDPGVVSEVIVSVAGDRINDPKSPFKQLLGILEKRLESDRKKNRAGKASSNSSEIETPSSPGL